LEFTYIGVSKSLGNGFENEILFKSNNFWLMKNILLSIAR
jgi:hypothetical protein